MTAKMTPKERLLRTIKGEDVDRVPWSPFLAYWWDYHQKPGHGSWMDQLAFQESVGADPLLRGYGMPWHGKCDPRMEFRTKNDGNICYQDWETPVGTLHFRTEYSAKGHTGFLVGHPIRTAEDLKILSWVFEHAAVEYNPDFDAEYKQIGDRALALPPVGWEMKTCFQSLVEKYVGIQNLSYLLYDEPEAVEECLAAMRRVSDKTVEFCAESPAEAFIFWEDSSTTSISPALFEKYTAKEVSQWADTLHQAGKLLVHHACGHLKALLEPMAKTGADVIESITPPTTGNVEIDDAFSVLPERITLIGGIEPVFFQNCTAEALEKRVDTLLSMANGRRFVLANADSCPPEVETWKFRFVSELLNKK